MKWASYLIFIAITMNFAATGWSQTQTTRGTIAGTILDAHGSPLSEASVTLRKLDRSSTAGLRRITVGTDQGGTFSVSGCAFGNYLDLWLAAVG